MLSRPSRQHDRRYGLELCAGVDLRIDRGRAILPEIMSGAVRTGISSNNSDTRSGDETKDYTKRRCGHCAARPVPSGSTFSGRKESQLGLDRLVDFRLAQTLRRAEFKCSGPRRSFQQSQLHWDNSQFGEGERPGSSGSEGLFVFMRVLFRELPSHTREKNSLQVWMSLNHSSTFFFVHVCVCWAAKVSVGDTLGLLWEKDECFYFSLSAG